jgi:hypothetical protein
MEEVMRVCQDQLGWGGAGKRAPRGRQGIRSPAVWEHVASWSGHAMTDASRSTTASGSSVAAVVRWCFQL